MTVELPPSHPPCGPDELAAQFGSIDIYLFDQLLKGRITREMRVLDAGCGAGRNVQFLIRCGADVHGIDTDPEQVDRIRTAAARWAPERSVSNFQVGSISHLPHPESHFEAVICNAVLHFAKDQTEFERMVVEMWRVLAPGGVLFVRLATTIGIRDRLRHLEDRWHRLPDGTDRFLVDEEDLLRITTQLNGRLLDPLKTTVVQNLRSMTTWVVGKSR